MRIDLTIGDLILESARPAGVEETRKILEEALGRLSDKLAKKPELWSARTTGIALESLELGDLSPEELFADRGAERLAEALHTALIRRLT